MALKTAIRTLVVAFGVCVAAISSSDAQEYPTRPIQIVTSVSIGSATDILARQFADKLQHQIGGSVIVVNKAGAGGTIAADFVAKSAPDGYTLFFGNSGLALFPFLYKKLPFERLKDFAGIALLPTAHTAWLSTTNLA